MSGVGTGSAPACGCADPSVVDLLLDTSDVVAIRFAPDAVWETVASLIVLAHPERHPLHRPLLTKVQDPGWDHQLLLSLLSDDVWYPDLLAPLPERRSDEPRTALAALADSDTRRERAETDLETLRELRPGERRWRRTTPAQLLEETAAALVAYWSAVLAPLWERVCEITSADLAFRSQTLAADGIAVTLTGLHERMTYGDDRLRLTMPGLHEHRAVGGAGVRFVPSVFRFPCLSAHLAGAPPVISYAARGAGRLWEAGAPETPGLDPLLGRSRVAILTGLEAPSTTTRLARLLRLSAGTVNEHLTTMRDAGLLTSSRRGREVLYERTDLGHALMQQWR